MTIFNTPWAMARKEKERGWSVTRGTGAARAAAKPVVWTGKMMRRTERQREPRGRSPSQTADTCLVAHTLS